MMTEQLNTALPKNVGYQNYADRTDVNGGADLGYKVTDEFAATWAIATASNTSSNIPFRITARTAAIIACCPVSKAIRGNGRHENSGRAGFSQLRK